MASTATETPISFICAIVRSYNQAKLDPGAALRAAQIAPGLLQDPQARITATQMELASGHAMRELNDEGLGWFSRPLPWGSNGMLCRASLTSANLRVALSRWCRHFGLLTSDIELELDVRGKVAEIFVHERVDLRDQRELCLVSTLRTIHGFACWLIDSRIPLLAATFPFDPPGHQGAYKHMFRGPVTFGERHAGLSFDAQYLTLPMRRDERELRQMLLRPLPLMVLQYRRDRLLSRQIRHLLRTRGADLPNAQSLAAAMNVSPRSLYRQLAEEGASLQKLKDEVRREFAIEQLNRSSRSLKQVAAATGFRSESSFNRAFRQWTGETPGEYRRSLAR